MTKAAEIRDYFTWDIEDCENWTSKPGDAVFALFELGIGEPGFEGNTVFQVVIATPEGLMRRPRGRGIVIEDRALIVVAKYDWPTIYEHLCNIVASIPADTYSEACVKLQRYFQWEYEDFIWAQEKDSPEEDVESP